MLKQTRWLGDWQCSKCNHTWVMTIDSTPIPQRGVWYFNAHFMPCPNCGEEVCRNANERSPAYQMRLFDEDRDESQDPVRSDR